MSAATQARIVTGGGGDDPPRHRKQAQVIPFPVVRRVGFIERTAEIASGYKRPAKYLASVYRQQEQCLRRRGFSDDVIQAEMAALQSAIQRRMLVSGGAA